MDWGVYVFVLVRLGQVMIGIKSSIIGVPNPFVSLLWTKIRKNNFRKNDLVPLGVHRPSRIRKCQLKRSEFLLRNVGIGLRPLFYQWEVQSNHSSNETNLQSTLGNHPQPSERQSSGATSCIQKVNCFDWSWVRTLLNSFNFLLDSKLYVHHISQEKWWMLTLV